MYKKTGLGQLLFAKKRQQAQKQKRKKQSMQWLIQGEGAQIVSKKPLFSV